MKETTYNFLSKIPFVDLAMIATENTPMPFSGLRIPEIALKWMKDHPGEVLTVKIFKQLTGN